MRHGSLYEVLPVLKEIDKERQTQFEEYFQSAPLWLLEAFRVEEMPKGFVFVQEEEPADTIYFVVRGVIEAIDFRFYGIVYEFMRFNRVYAMGGMEFIMDLDTYQTTLRTVTKCTMLKLPASLFAKWMTTDIQAMKNEARLVGEYLLEQGRRSRAMLFLQGSDRLAMLLVERYEHYARHGVLYISSGRQDLSNATGLSVKTINRAVKKFYEEGLITKEGNKLLLDEQQYKRLKENLEAVIQENG